MKYRAEIDGLRAIAVIPVILFHAGCRALSGGYVGVDIFFVISGYLITRIILAEKEAGTFSLAHFYGRRARRILPALFFVMLVCLPFAWLWLLPEDMKSFAQSLIAVPTFVSNFLFWKTSGYFDIAADLKPLLHTWSLAVEEQYYLLFPLLLIATWRWGRKVILFLLLTVFGLSLALAQWGSVHEPDAAYYLLLSRAWEILMGALVAFYLAQHGRAPWSPTTQQAGGLIGLALIGCALFAFDNQTPFPSVYGLVPTTGAALIILCADSKTFVGKLLAQKWLVGVGLASYSAYLWHQPLLVFARHRAYEGMNIQITVGVLLLTAGLAYLTWRYVEAPFRHSQRLSQRQIIQFSIWAALLFILVGAAGHMTDGFKNRFTFVEAHEGDIGQADFYKTLDGHFFLCNPKSLAHDPQNKITFRCLQSKRNTDVDIALIGDSHAEHLSLGMASHLSDKNVLIYSRASHPSINSPDFKAIYQYVLNSHSVQHVLIAAHWVSKVDHVPKNSTLDQELISTINALIRKGKRVYLFGDVPKFPFAPERCKYMAEGLKETVCTVPKEQILKYEKTYSAALENVRQQIPQLNYMELRDIFCNEFQCSMLKENKLMYRDYNHLNILGSNLVGDYFVKNIYMGH